MSDGRITVLVEDTTQGRGLLAEHGLAFWIEFGPRKVLFDTGQSDMLVRNARVLDIDLGQADAVVLSHGHYDHVGGLEKILEITRAIPIYFHRQALEAKFSCSDGQSREIGMKPDLAETLKQRISDGLGAYTNGSVEILPGVWTTGPIPRKSEFEDVGGPFYLDSDGMRPDVLLDDQALVLATDNGLVVVLGCAHAGVVNTLDYVAELFPGQTIHMVLGGMHLIQASRARIDHTIEAVRRHRVRRIGPAHCTGRSAVARIWHELPENCFACSTGTQITL